MGNKVAQISFLVGNNLARDIETGVKQTRYRIVYALYKPGLEKKSDIIYKKMMDDYKKNKPTRESKHPIIDQILSGHIKPTRKPIEFIKPFSDDNQRLINQNGLFTRSPIGEDLEKWIDGNYKNHKRYILMKILIPNSNRIDCLRTLNRMNINHLTLFPDLFGASVYCNLYSEIKNY